MKKYALLTALFLFVSVKSFAAPYDHIHLAATSSQEAVNWYVKHFGGEAFSSLEQYRLSDRPCHVW